MKLPLALETDEIQKERRPSLAFRIAAIIIQSRCLINNVSLKTINFLIISR